MKDKDSMITRLTPKEVVLKLGEDCCKDGKCCSYDSGIVLKDEIDTLAKNLKVSREEFIKNFVDEVEKFNTTHYKFKIMKEKGKAYGKCIFLNSNECSIHKHKPLHCRVGNCGEHGESLSIWFTLNHFVNPDDPESIRQWAIYLKTHPTIPGGSLSELVPNKERLKKIMNYELLR
jgi:Fe-S-cluster containining protein